MTDGITRGDGSTPLHGSTTAVYADDHVATHGQVSWYMDDFDREDARRVGDGPIDQQMLLVLSISVWF
jgi:hypothetical protein